MSLLTALVSCTDSPPVAKRLPPSVAVVAVAPTSPAPRSRIARKSAPSAVVALQADGPRLSLPTRPLDAIGGIDFVRATANVSAAERELMIEREFLRGNVPDFLRVLKAVEFQGEASTIRLWVLPDYIAIGSDDDFVRMPMNAHTAARLARATGMGLPTPRIVAHIAEQATVRATPRAMTPGPEMVSSASFERHNRLIEDEIGHHLFGELVAGDKKDIVVANLSREDRNRIVIYGWHDRGNHPIQAVSNIHDAEYVDYSHGVRLVSAAIEVNGQNTTLAKALSDPETAELLSHEGVIMDYEALLVSQANPAMADVSRYGGT